MPHCHGLRFSSALARQSARGKGIWPETLTACWLAPLSQAGRHQNISWLVSGRQAEHALVAHVYGRQHLRGLRQAAIEA